MNISQKFKDYIQGIYQSIKEKYELTNINEITNTEILTSLKKLIDIEGIDTQYLSIGGEYAWLTTIISPEHVSAIDNEYIRTNAGIFYWDGIVEIINGKMETYVKMPEEKTIPIGTICKVVGVRKLVQIDMRHINSMSGKYYMVCDDEGQQISTTYKSLRFSNVIVKDISGNCFLIPACILKPTKEKDFDSIAGKILYADIIEELIDKKKNDIAVLTTKYSNTLKSFMEASQMLHDVCVLDIEEEAKKQVDYKINFIKDIKQNKQVSNIKVFTGESIEFETEPIFSDCGNLPMGRYRVYVNLKSWEVRIKNIDISSDREYQHPHIDSNGQCCLGDFIDPLRKAWDERDYVTLIAGIMSFLESLYEDSVYTSMENFQSKRRKKFEYQIPVVETPVIKKTTPKKPRAKKEDTETAGLLSDDTVISDLEADIIGDTISSQIF